MSALSRVISLSPFGPIFGKELRVTSRRKRTYLLRVGYLAMLLLAMLFAYGVTANRGYGGVARQTMQQAELGHAFFVAFSVFCIWSMGLIGPVLTANAIGAERLAKTLPVLLMTPINAWQVVSGKLLSRVLTALTLIGLSLPVLALVRLLGGVELNVMLATLAVAVSYVIACAALGLFLSNLMNRPALVILLSYGILGIVYLIAPMLITMFSAFRGPGPGMGIIKVFLALNPPAWAVSTSEPRIGSIAMATWYWCAGVQLTFALILVWLTSLRLRRQFQTDGERSSPAVATPLGAPVPVVAYPPPLPGSMGLPPQPTLYGNAESDAGGYGVATPPPLPVEPLGYASQMTRRAVKVREVSDNPVLWREVRRPLMSRVWQRVVTVVVVCGIIGLFYLAMADSRSLDDIGPHIGFAIIFCGLWWLLSAVLAATAISQEKETDTWTLLLASPLTGKQIVWGKVAGLLRRMLWPTVLVAGHFLIFSLFGVLPFWGALFAIVMIVLCNTTWIATGVWLSLRMKRVTFAVITNLLLAVVVYGVVPLAIFIPIQLVSRTNRDVAEHALWHNPYYFLGSGFDGMRRSSNAYRYRYNYNNYGDNDDYDYYQIPSKRVNKGPFMAAAATCALLHLFAAVLILMSIARRFDEIVARAGKQRFAGVFETDDAVLSANELSGTTGDASTLADANIPANPQTKAGDIILPKSLDIAAQVAAINCFGSLPRRIAAWLLDTIVIQVACAAVGLCWGVVEIVLTDDTRNSEIDEILLDRFTKMMIAALVVGWVYFAGYEASSQRATPGKALFGLFVTDDQGRRLSFLRASGRYFAKLLSISSVVGLVIATFDPRRQALHDKVAGTLILRR